MLNVTSSYRYLNSTSEHTAISFLFDLVSFVNYLVWSGADSYERL